MLSVRGIQPAECLHLSVDCYRLSEVATCRDLGTLSGSFSLHQGLVAGECNVWVKSNGCGNICIEHGRGQRQQIPKTNCISAYMALVFSTL